MKIEDDLEKLINEIEADLGEGALNADIGHINTANNTFKVGDLKYELTITPAKFVKDAVIAVFRLVNNPNQPQFKDFGGDMKKYLKAKEDAEMGDVSTGGVGMRVIGTVMTFYKKYIESNKPKIFIFHARNDDRAKNYLRLGKKLADSVGYSVRHKKDESTGITEIWLCRGDVVAESDTDVGACLTEYVYIKNYT